MSIYKRSVKSLATFLAVAVMAGGMPVSALAETNEETAKVTSESVNEVTAEATNEIVDEVTAEVTNEIVDEATTKLENDVEANGTADVSGLDWEIVGTTLTIKSNAGTSDWQDNGRKLYYSIIERVVLQDEVGWINSEEFSDCSKLSSIKISDKVSTIPSSAFESCTSLTSVDIPEGVSDLSAAAFGYCTSLTDINVNNNNSTYCSIDGIVYSKDTETLICYPVGKTAKKFTIPNAVKSIGEFAFYQNNTLCNIEIQGGVSSIEHGAFWKCLALESINLPKSLISIKNGAFFQCGIFNIEIPENVENIEVGAFSACIRLTEINVNNNNAVYYSIDGVLYEKNTKKLLRYPAGKADIEFTVPSGTCSISEFAFSTCTKLSQIVIPESVSSIGNYAFDRCIGMKQITFLSKIPPDIGKKIFSSAFNMSVIYVPSTSVDNYKEVENLSTYVDSIQDNINSTVTVNQGSGSGNYDRYSTVTIEANPDTQERVFQSWSCSDGVVLADASIRKTTFTMPGNDVTVTANYINYYPVTIDKGTIPTSYYKEGDTVTITANLALDGQEFTNWTTNDGITFANASSLTTTFTMPAKSVTITANYKASKVEVTGMTLSQTSADLKAGNSVTLSATITPSNATNSSMTWSSNNTDIAIVDQSGTITAKGVGSAVITVTSNSNASVSATCMVNVAPNIVTATGLELNPTNIDLKVGNTETVSAAITPSNATDASVTWSSSDTDIATVDENGMLTGKGIGSANITATSNSNTTLTATCSINVSIGKVDGLTAKKNKTTSITLTWNKQNNVKGYVIYRYDSAKKKYVKISTIKKASTVTYTDKKLSVSSTYQYKVRAYVKVGKKTKYGSYSDILKTATISKKAVLSVKAGSKKATLTWDKVSSVSGYEIYMSTNKKSGYSKIKTLSSKKTNYTKKKLLKGKTYYFKIRTYKKVAGVKLYSSYSSVKKVKVK
ncbi:MAG: leucine-rich repeat protein [Lachnotalea sp.]